jgi:putative hydrolase of the HAD superfamily
VLILGRQNYKFVAQMQNFKPEIKNIIFDLGGVLLNIDYNKSISAFEKLGFPDFSHTYSQAQQNPVFDAFETGKISEAEFFKTLNRIFNSDFKVSELRHCWNAMLLDFPKHRVDLLKHLAKQYRLFLLSNTNVTHQIAFDDIIQSCTGIQKLNDLFESAYYSHCIGLRKPDEDAFNFVIQENNLNVHETLFIDDSIQHIHGALKVGLQTFFLEKGSDVCDYFKFTMKQ